MAFPPAGGADGGSAHEALPPADMGQSAGSGLPGSLAIAIAVVGTLWVTLAVASAAKPIHLQPTRRSAANAIISRKKSASGVFSISASRAILSVFIVSSPSSGYGLDNLSLTKINAMATGLRLPVA